MPAEAVLAFSAFESRVTSSWFVALFAERYFCSQRAGGLSQRAVWATLLNYFHSNKRLESEKREVRGTTKTKQNSHASCYSTGSTAISSSLVCQSVCTPVYRSVRWRGFFLSCFLVPYFLCRFVATTLHISGLISFALESNAARCEVCRRWLAALRNKTASFI